LIKSTPRLHCLRVSRMNSSRVLHKTPAVSAGVPSKGTVKLAALQGVPRCIKLPVSRSTRGPDGRPTINQELHMARTAFVVNMRCARKCGTWPVAVSRRTTSSKSSAAPRKHCASVSVVSSIAAWPRPMRQSPAFCSRPPRPATSQRDRALPIGERSETVGAV